MSRKFGIWKQCPRKMNTLRMYNIYMRVLIFWQWLVELFNRIFIVALMDKHGVVYVKLRGCLVKLELYPSNEVDGFLIGNSYWSTNKPPPITMCHDDSDQD